MSTPSCRLLPLTQSGVWVDCGEFLVPLHPVEQLPLHVGELFVQGEGVLLEAGVDRGWH